MGNLGEVLGVAMGFLLFAVLVGLFAIGVRLAVQDARRRGKSPVLVSIACVLFFPWGLIAWIIFRPDPIDRGRGDGFRLNSAG